MVKKVSDEAIRKVMQALGQRTSKRKAEAARENGKKGGRPKRRTERAV